MGGWWSLGLGLDAELLPLLATVLGFALVLPLERWAPRVARAPEPGETWVDALWFSSSATVDALAGAGLAGLAVAVAPSAGAGPLGALPLPVAALLALLLWSLGDYWAHRLAHEVPWLWRFHAVHHAPRRMVATNNPRLHPADLLLKRTAQLLPLLLLGFSGDAMALVGALAGLQVAFQHGDVDIRHGAWNLVFATNSVHRWHHSDQPHEANANYGAVLVLWDQVFGTFRVPPEEEEPERMGLFDGLPYPVQQPLRALAAPWCWARCTSGSP